MGDEYYEDYSSRGFIYRSNGNLFSYNLDLDGNIFTKKKYNFEEIFERLIEIYPKIRNDYKFLKRALINCLRSKGSEEIEIDDDEAGMDDILSNLTLYINSNVVVFKYILLCEDETKQKIFQILLDNHVIEETKIVLNN